MKKFVIAALATCALIAPALAADLAPRPVYKAPPPPPPPIWSWTGFYIGANAGWIGSTDNTITNALTPVGGVRTVNVDIPARQVRVEYDESVVDINKMKDVLQEEDYPVESVA